jgi:heptosyltransferase III
MPEKAEQPRILVLRGGAIGDFVVTLPAFQALRARWPDAHLECIGYPHVTALALAAGVVDRADSLHKADVARLFSWRPELTPEQETYIRSFNVILSYLYDLDGTVTRNLVTAGARRVIYGSPLVRDRHAVDHLLKPLEELAIYAVGDEYPRLDLPEALRQGGRQRVHAMGERAVAIHPGSGSLKKNWPLDRFLELAGALERSHGLTPIFICGEADVEIQRDLESRGLPIHLVTGCNLVELAALLVACVAYVGNDSGVTHIAAAVGTPVVALFGPTDPALWAPRGSAVRVIRAAEPTTASLAEIPVAAVLRAVPA